ncbi:hypothetical protein AB0I84_32160 [Streptomyces spectabilis]|uniref:hypothetical protein n=1 Tax=Streptomyces spectabilis TaxID=68270 RepID=UPI0033E56A5A
MASPRAQFPRAVAAAVAAAALIGLASGTANAAQWPPLREGAYLYSGTHGTGKEVRVDLDDVGTCHALSAPPRSLQIASGSASLVLYPGADCADASSWASGSLAQTDLPWAARSYRVVPA